MLHSGRVTSESSAHNPTPDTGPRPVLVLAGAFALSLLYAIRVWCPDAWWHLATGRWMVANGRIPDVDPFSFTAQGQPWNDVNWASDLVLYGAYLAGGFAGVVCLKILLAFGLLSSLGLALRKLGVRTGALTGTLILVAFLLQPRYSMARPSTLGGVFMAVGLLLAVWAWKQRERHFLPWLFVPLTLVWQQFHPSSIVGLAQCAVLAVALLVAARDRAAGHGLGAFVASAALFVVTPQGREIIGHFLTYQEDSLIVQRTLEWAPLKLEMPLVWVPWTLFAVAVVGGALVARRAPLAWGLAIVGVALGVRFTRHLYPGVLLVAPMLAILAQVVVDGVRRRGLPVLAHAIGPALGGAVVAVNLVVVPLPVFHNNFGFEADVAAYPHDTLPVLKALPTGRAMNDYGIGGYLIWGEVPGGVFFDGRSAQVFTEAHFRDIYRPAETSEEGLERVADAHDVVYGIAKVRSHVGNQMMQSALWVPVHHGQTTSLFVRRVHVDRVLTTGRPLFPLLRWSARRDWTARHYREVMADPEARAQLKREFVAALRADADALVVRNAFSHLERAHPTWTAELRASLTR